MTETGAMSSGLFAELPIPAQAGIGLRHPHVLEIIEDKPDIARLEVHSENYLAAGGARMRQLEAIRQDYPLSCHGVALSLGSVDGLDQDHLAQPRNLFDRFEPGLISDHVSWTTTGGTYLNDLLPLPYTEEALDVICRNVDQAQEAFGRPMLVENPSSYVTFHASTIPEWVFMAEIARRTGCGILLDVNNIFVSSHNHGFDATAYIDAIPADAVGEIHIAGHARREMGAATILIDDHSSAPIDRVWDLLDHALAHLGATPVLMEWDGDIPALSVLTAVAETAQRHLDQAAPGKLAHVA
jgi:uncharacterized protein (UPF0276 family)